MSKKLTSCVLVSVIATSLAYAAEKTEEKATQTDTPAAISQPLTSVGCGYGFLVKGEGKLREIMLVIDSRWPDDLNFVGGAQEKGELSEETFIRKVKEKTGLTVEKTTHVGSWQRTIATTEGGNDTCIFFAGHIKSDTPDAGPNKKFLNSQHWYSLSDVAKTTTLDKLFPSHRIFLEHYLNGMKAEQRHIIKDDFEPPKRKMSYYLG